MTCKKCKVDLVYVCEKSVQGWVCPICGEKIVTTYISDMEQDLTDYSIYIKKAVEIDNNKIRVISKLAGVNFLEAKKILQEGNVCILRAKAVEIRDAMLKLESGKIPFEVIPNFIYQISSAKKE